MATQEAPKQARRQPGLGRELLLAAARDEFSERGYARATTREIARRADVAEPLLFRHFGSKAALFSEVVFGPMRAFMVEWEEHIAEAGEEADAEALALRFVGGLYDLLRENRGLIVTYLATRVFEPDVLDEPDGIPTLLEVIRLMDRTTDERVAVGSPRGRRAQVMMKGRVHERINIGSVIAAALFDELLFAGMPTRPTRNQIVNELARIAVVSLPSTAS